MVPSTARQSTDTSTFSKEEEEGDNKSGVTEVWPNADSSELSQ